MDALTPEEIALIRQGRAIEKIEELSDDEQDLVAAANARLALNRTLSELTNAVGSGVSRDFATFAEFFRQGGAEVASTFYETFVTNPARGLQRMEELGIPTPLSIGRGLRNAVTNIESRATGFLNPESAVDVLRFTIDPDDPLQQIPADADETVTNNAPVLNDEVIGAMEDLGPQARPDPNRPPPGQPDPAPQRRPITPLDARRRSTVAPGYDRDISQQPELRAGIQERDRVVGLVDDVTGLINRDEAAINALTADQLVNLLEADEYNRSVAAASLVGTPQVPSVSDSLNRLGSVPGVGGEVSSILPALRAANPALSSPSIQPGIEAQARAFNQVAGTLTSAQSQFQSTLLDRVALQDQLRADLRQVVLRRLGPPGLPR